MARLHQVIRHRRRIRHDVDGPRAVRRADPRGDATVYITVKEANGLLPWRIVSERVVHLRVNEAWNRSRVVRINHNITARDVVS